ncbi:MAG: hypothetical protein RIQ33_1371 [Bacteroidota bacterium]|jgi:hypothetical protein
MQAIEINSITDSKGHLKIDYPLHKKRSKVRMLILVNDDNDIEDEKLWMASVSTNPAFDFLKDSSEDIYSLNDGKCFSD